jgi:hypothetical protein
VDVHGGILERARLDKKYPSAGMADRPLSSVASVPLSSSQAVRIHGWTSPSRRLTWQKVRERTDLSFCTLFNILADNKTNVSTGLTVEATRALDTLYMLQPDILEWVRESKVALVDYEVMHMRWNVDPVTDFGNRVKVGEILQARFSHRAMVGCHLYVDTLFSVGMTPEIMVLFGFTFEQWLRLGLRRRHIEPLTCAQVENVFHVTKNVVEASLRDDEDENV